MDLETLRKLSVEDLLLPVMVQLVVIILVARLFAYLFRKIGQTSVVGEICAGVVLGPSLLGAFFPELFHALFQPKLPEISQAVSNELLKRIFAVLSQLGLIFLLFLMGIEFDYGHLKKNGKSALAICLSGIALPFALGFGLGYLIHPYLEPHPEKGLVDPLGLSLFLGVALSITAIPVLGRILMELNITRTRIGTIAISAAAFGDALGWILLAAVAATVQTGFDWKMTLWMILSTALFGLFIYFLARPLLIRWLRWSMRQTPGEIGIDTLAIFLGVLFFCAILTNLIGIFAIFGPFCLGAVLSDQEDFREAIMKRMSDLVMTFFLPIFFMYTGLRTEFSSLDSLSLWLICGAICLAALVGKLGGCGIAAYWSGFSKRESTIIGILMNTRGLVELIVINVGYDLGVIPKSVFCMLVIMALLTTIMTTPILLRLVPGTELEEHVRKTRR